MVISAEAILEHLTEGIYCLDQNRKIIFWNRAAELITGYSSAEVLGRSCSDNLLVHVDNSGRELCLCGCPLTGVLNGTEDSASSVVYLHHKEGHRIPVNVRVSPIRSASGTIIGATELFWPSLYKPIEESGIEELRHAALVDPLTDLSNRRSIDLDLVSTIEESKRHHIPFGLLFADIDNFKSINDNYGHDVGDRVIQMVARTLSSSVRAYDHVGRWGGEEFLVIAKHLDQTELHLLAVKLKTLVSKSFFLVNEHPLSVTITIGTAHSSAHESVSSLMKQADTNLLLGKTSGKNCVISD